MAAAGVPQGSMEANWQCKSCHTFNWPCKNACRTCAAIRWPAPAVATAKPGTAAGPATLATSTLKSTVPPRPPMNAAKGKDGSKKIKHKTMDQNTSQDVPLTEKARLSRLQQLRTSLQQAGASDAALGFIDADITAIRETMVDTRTLDEQLAGITGAITRTERRAQAARDAMAQAQAELQKEEEQLARYRQSLADVQAKIRHEAGLSSSFPPVAGAVPPWVACAPGAGGTRTSRCSPGRSPRGSRTSPRLYRHHRHPQPHRHRRRPLPTAPRSRTTGASAAGAQTDGSTPGSSSTAGSGQRRGRRSGMRPSTRG